MSFTIHDAVTADATGDAIRMNGPKTVQIEGSGWTGTWTIYARLEGMGWVQKGIGAADDLVIVPKAFEYRVDVTVAAGSVTVKHEDA